MISFASSIWLWAMAGIIIPLLIHLWNVRKGKTLKVGSISFFSETPISRARSLRLTDLLLLLIRCLIFLLLAMFIAKPILSSTFSSNKQGWLLIEKSTIPAVYREYGNEIDSMLDRGAELHELGGNFEVITLADSTVNEQAGISYWELLRELEHKIPGGLPVKVYTENRLARFYGARPILNLNLDWKTVDTNHETTWIEQAYTGYDDSIVMVIGKSSGEGTTFNKHVLSESDQMINPDPLSVQYENDTMRVDTSELNISIYADAGTKDGQYLAYAINAVKEFTKRKIHVNIVSDTSRMENADWLFWLSERKLPVNATAKNIFSYAGGKMHSVVTNFSIQNKNDLIPAYRVYMDTIIRNGATIWLTGYGQPLLTRHTTRPEYIFYSRLDPKWNGLVWSGQFPQFVIDLLYPVQQMKGRDNRMIDDQQLLPMVKTSKHSNARAFTRPLDHWFWIIAIVLFLIERIVSYRKQKPANV